MLRYRANVLPAVLFVLLIWPVAAGGAQSMDEEKVRATNKAFYDAFSNRDLQKMKEVWSKTSDVTAIHPNGKEILFGKQAGEKHWTDLFSRFSEIDISMIDPQVQVGSSLAWVVGVEKFRARLADGKDVTSTVLATNVFEKHDNAWRMVHHHASQVPKK